MSPASNTTRHHALPVLETERDPDFDFLEQTSRRRKGITPLWVFRILVAILLFVISIVLVSLSLSLILFSYVA